MNELSQHIKEHLLNLNAPGACLGVRQGTMMEMYNVGFANLSSDTPVTNKTIFDIASIGKLITAVLILDLVEKEELTLDAQLGAFITEVPEEWKEISISHLLTHTSGLGEYTQTKAYWDECKLDVTKTRILEYVRNTPLQFIPGDRWDYNNTGYFLLGLVIEKITNQEYFAYASGFLNSFGLQNIIKTSRTPHNPNQAIGYNIMDQHFQEVDYYSNSGTFSAGGFSSSVNDFLLFENLLFQKQILKAHMLMTLLKPVSLNGNLPFHVVHPHLDFEMRHGIFSFSKYGRTLFAHGGATQGFSSSYLRVFEDDLTLVVTTNVSDLSDELLKLLLNLSQKLHGGQLSAE